MAKQKTKTEVVKKDDVQEKKNLPAIEVFRKELTGETFKHQLQIALGKKKDVDKYIRGVLTTMLTTENDRLLQCSKHSVMRSILTSAQIGLEVDAKGHAYLVPYNNSKKKTVDAQLLIGYKGYIYKAKQSNSVRAFNAFPVYRDDKIEVSMGSKPEIIHKPDIFSAYYGKDEHITHWYAVVEFITGGVEFEIMTREQVEKLIPKDYNGNWRSFWKYHFESMGRKTPIRRLAQRLQLPELDELILHDNKVEKELKEADGEEPKDEDYTMTEYKKKIVPDIRKGHDILGYNEAKRLADYQKYLHTDNPYHATEGNLQELHEVVSRRVTYESTKKKNSKK